MVSSLTKAEFVALNRQIVATLANNGPAGSSELLGLLQASFPDQGWTSDLLTELLSLGVRQGRYCAVAEQLGVIPEVLLYQNRADMVKINASNWVYQDLDARICKLYSCSTLQTGKATAPYNGAEAC